MSTKQMTAVRDAIRAYEDITENAQSVAVGELRRLGREAERLADLASRGEVYDGHNLCTAAGLAAAALAKLKANQEELLTLKWIVSQYTLPGESDGV